MFVRSIGTQIEDVTALEDVANANTTSNDRDAPKTFNSTGTLTDINGVSDSRVLRELFNRALTFCSEENVCRDESVKVRSMSQTKGGNDGFLDIYEVHKQQMKPDQLEKTRNEENGELMMSSLKKDDFQEQRQISHNATANGENSRQIVIKGLVDGQQLHLQKEILEAVPQISGGINYDEPVANHVNERELNNELLDGHHDTDDVEIIPSVSGVTSCGTTGKEHSTNELCLGEIAESVYHVILGKYLPWEFPVNPAEDVSFERDECDKLNNDSNRQDMLSSVTNTENALGQVEDETLSISGEPCCTDTIQNQEQSTSSGEVRFKCPQCEKNFKCRTDFVRHFRIHTGERPFKCTQCDKAFKRKHHLVDHLQIHTEERLYKCTQCNKAFKTSRRLSIHFQNHTEEMMFKCMQCNKAFNTRATLVRHLRIHTGERPYKCAQCNKAFKRKHHLLDHLEIHTEEKLYKCTQCNKAFKTSRCLSIHFRNHTAETMFKCMQCNKAFNTRSTLVRHLRIHTGERPFKCAQCDKAFKRKHHLLHHLRIHTGERLYNSTQCT